ncbi:hypothetical protein ABFS82_02G000400 [Erythranthe guttata]
MDRTPIIVSAIFSLVLKALYSCNPRMYHNLQELLHGQLYFDISRMSRFQTTNEKKGFLYTHGKTMMVQFLNY